MANAQRFPFTAVTKSDGEIALRPLLPIILSYNNSSISTVGLLDTGADVNILPYPLGIALGASWEQHEPLSRVSGNLGRYEARGILLTGVVQPFAPVDLIFAWIRDENAPLLLGQMNFFDEFAACFFRAQGIFDIQPTG